MRVKVVCLQKCMQCLPQGYKFSVSYTFPRKLKEAVEREEKETMERNQKNVLTDYADNQYINETDGITGSIYPYISIYASGHLHVKSVLNFCFFFN